MRLGLNSVDKNPSQIMQVFLLKYQKYTNKRVNIQQNITSFIPLDYWYPIVIPIVIKINTTVFYVDVWTLSWQTKPDLQSAQSKNSFKAPDETKPPEICPLHATVCTWSLELYSSVVLEHDEKISPFCSFKLSAVSHLMCLQQHTAEHFLECGHENRLSRKRPEEGHRERFVCLIALQ